MASMCLSPEPAYRLGLEIAGISMSLRAPLCWAAEEAFLPFVKEREMPDYRVEFRRVDQLPPVPGGVVHEDECYRVHPDGKGGYVRSFFDAPREDSPYAVAEYDHQTGVIRIDYLEKGGRCVSELHNSFFHLGFEALLIRKGRLCLHAACVKTGLGGILFSGPSGIGKSTQAELWCRFRGAELINGDRPILSREGGSWLAWGSPYAGSSKCHRNENCPVTAVVLLEQASRCGLERLTGSAAFRAVWQGLTVQNWDRCFVENASALAAELIGSVPVFRFRCTPDESAVEYLERELGKECCLWMR